MAVVSLTFTPSTSQTIAGIPDSVEISVNAAATIYYTLDGSLPTVFSNVYTEAIELPTDQNSVTLSAIAYYLDDDNNLVPSAVLSNTYAPDQEDLDRTRYIFFEGVVYSYPGGLNIPFYYDQNGEAAFSIDVPEDDLLLLRPERDHLGLPNDLATDVEPVDPDNTATLIDNEISAYQSPNDDTFHPEAYFIVIDGREDASPQVVNLINGPYMSLRDLKTSYGGIEFYNNHGTLYISGDSTRYHYDRQKGIIVFYYFDSNTNRWVKSLQDLSASPAQVKPTPVIQNPLVFRWFNMGRHQAV